MRALGGFDELRPISSMLRSRRDFEGWACWESQVVLDLESLDFDQPRLMEKHGTGTPHQRRLLKIIFNEIILAF